MFSLALRMVAFYLLVMTPTVLCAADKFHADFLNELFAPVDGAEPIPVQVGVRIQQITDVNQKKENFGVVATIMMRWHDEHITAAALKPGERLRQVPG